MRKHDDNASLLSSQGVAAVFNKCAPPSVISGVADNGLKSIIIWSESIGSSRLFTWSDGVSNSQEGHRRFNPVERKFRKEILVECRRFNWKR